MRDPGAPVPPPDHDLREPAGAPVEPPALRLRAVLVGLAAEAVAFAWVADSEIRQSVYLVCYSLLMPAVVALSVLLGCNAIVARARPRAALSRRDLVVVYAMLTCSLPIAGFGGLRFVLPSLGLPFYPTTADNWGRFAGFLPRWLAPHGAALWRGFFRGNSTPPWAEWTLPVLYWGSLLLALAGLWLCLNLLLRRRWVEAERLTFPIVYLPLRMIAAPREFFSSRGMWLGFAVPAVLQSALALNHLYPWVPAIQLKAWDAGAYLSGRPWSAVGYLPVGLYPAAVGLAYFVPTEVSFSCWFFYVLTKALNVLGAVAGMDMSGQSQAAVRFPYPQEQAAGAWMALGVMALSALRRPGAGPRDRAWRDERWARAGAAAFSAFALALVAASGVPIAAGALMLAVYVLYVVCGARVRAEVGAQWTFAPLIWTPTHLTLSTLGTVGLGDHGIVATSLFEPINVDVRGQAMPNQLEALRLAGAQRLGPAHVAIAIAIATVAGLLLAAATSLWTWHDAGAATAHANSYALTKSQIVWQNLARHFDSRTPPDREGLAAVGVGAAATVWLARMRAASLSWPLHPIGYVLANTLTVNAFWVPFLLAWLAKTLVRRYGGIGVYRRLVLFFTGVVLGDIAVQSAWTIAGRLLGFPVYQFLT